MVMVYTAITRYRVSILPEDDVNSRHYALTVEWRGGDWWAVCWMGECLSADGEWDYEPLSSARTDEWLAAHRFDHDTALDLAAKTAPKLSVNGITAEQELAKRGAR